MRFKIEKRENPNLQKYSKDDLEVAYKFSEKAYKEFGDFIKAIVLFGSQSRREIGQKLDIEGVGDIDLLIIVDDTSLYLTSEVIETYRVITEKIAFETSDRLHITTLQLTHFWDYCRAGDPLAINMLRDGVSLLDIGFFEPLQILLKQGRIRPTPESVWSYLGRTGPTLFNSKWHLLQATLDLYWAVIDAAHAALMDQGEIPPSPSQVSDMLYEKLVKKKLLESKYVNIMKQFYDLSRKIIHREIKEIKGKDYEQYLKDAQEFCDRMRDLVLKKK